MSLKKYKSKRDLTSSPEPKAKIHPRNQQQLHFVIQKHDATRLHYDFRLEMNGVLKSWAIPKGPSLNPQDKRLAIMVEDHPFDYKDFEGVISEGYGAGTVMVWDEGTYNIDNLSPKDSEKRLANGLKKGEVHFTLNEKKLHGEFSLVKLSKPGNKSEWLLIKKKDSFASNEDITTQDLSVISKRNLYEIARGKQEHTSSDFSLEQVPLKKMRHHIKPMYATLVDQPFDHQDWVFEIKWDGFRAIAEVNHQNVEIYSRYLQPFNQRFPKIVEDLKQLKFSAIFDGEIVVLNEKGHADFQALQNIQRESLKNKSLHYYIFDLLYLEGHDLRSIPLIERKTLLEQLFKNLKSPCIHFCDHIEKEGIKFFQLSKQNHLEGIIGKHKQSLYYEGKRSKQWVKIKTIQRQEAIICGFTEPRGGRKSIGALILGIYENNELKFIGHCGGGLSDEMLNNLASLLSPYIQKKSPFKIVPKTNTAVTWIKPHFMCEVSFSEWTAEGFMRQPIFIGLRDDKSLKSVVKEETLTSKEVFKGISEKPKPKKTLTKPVEFTHLDKIYWPKEKITKGALIDYYQSISKFILPYLKDKPESLKRNPNGIDKPSFFQKDLEYYPDWIKTTMIKHEEKDVHYLLIQDEPSLLFAVNLGCIEINPLLSKFQTLNHPDFLVLDLDPEDIPFEKVVEVALVIHKILDEIDIPAYCKTSGATGLHICIPLKAKYSYEQAKQFAQIIATIAHHELPHISSIERSPKKRQKKVYIDYLQNNFGQTITAPYSVRPRSFAPVSTPLEWSELKKGLDPSQFNIYNTLKRLEKKGDLFKPVLGKGINLRKALKNLEKLNYSKLIEDTRSY